MHPRHLTSGTMNDQPTAPDRLNEVALTMLDLRDGRADEHDVARLRALLESDQDARLLYLRLNQLDYLLESSPAVARKRRFPIRIPHLLSATIGALAAAVALLLAIGHWRQQTTPVAQHAPELPVASLLSGYNAVIDGEAATGAQSFGEGELLLDRGFAELAFRNGTQIVLDGKCGFEIIDANTVVLNHGRLWAHCPPEAHGFRVLTPGGTEIIDLGTEFGVEVSASGVSNVHVFDGLVDVVDNTRSSRRITAGSALQWTRERLSPDTGTADPTRFVTVSQLATIRLEAHQAEMLTRDDLLLYYDFAEISGARIRNMAPGATEESHGTIRGAKPGSGRTEGKGSLLFEHRGDEIAFTLARPPQVTGFTIAVWVKIDRLDSSLAALVNSNGWEPGDIHFNVTRFGGLRSGIHGGPAFQSPSHTVETGKWHLLAVSWDITTREARLYCDGQPLETKPYDNNTAPSDDLDPQFGRASVGSWINRPADKWSDVRDLKGRIDELMIFDHMLTDDELARLHSAGRP
jgi:ferric-dicitrate binding protein FerR (iron transport regulator)